jgi:phage-related protein
VVYYAKNDGSIPIIKFIDDLPIKLQAKTFRSINLLAENGNELPERHTRFVRNGLYELRVHQGSDIVRVLYFFMNDRRIILTNGFVKKSNKLPLGEIELAIKYKSDYLERIRNEGQK